MFDLFNFKLKENNYITFNFSRLTNLHVRLLQVTYSQKNLCQRLISQVMISVTPNGHHGTAAHHRYEIYFKLSVAASYAFNQTTKIFLGDQS